MNVYFCDAGEHDELVEVIDYWPRYEPIFVNEVVFAETPGRAKSLFIRHRSQVALGLEFTDVRARKLGQDQEREQPGVASWRSHWWEHVHERSLNHELQRQIRGQA